MKKYERKTVDRWDIETNYGYGWEAEYSIYDHKKAKQIYKDYVKNCIKLMTARNNLRCKATHGIFKVSGCSGK